LSAAAVDALCGRAAGDPHCWQRAKADLAALMQEECEGHWLDVMQAAPDSPVVLPTLTGVRVLKNHKLHKLAKSGILPKDRRHACWGQGICVYVGR
jgi:hypothetical protein